MVPGNKEDDQVSAAVVELTRIAEAMEAGQMSETQAKVAFRALFDRLPQLGQSFAEAMRETARLKGAPWAIVNWPEWLASDGPERENSR